MSIVARLLLIFTLIPIVEISLLIPLHTSIGTWATIGLICTTAISGTILSRWQGTEAINRIKETMGKGGLPGEEILDGVLVLLSGAMLITPGVLTDVVGLSMLLPFVRRPVREYVKRRALKWMDTKAKSYVSVESASYGFGGDDYYAPADSDYDLPENVVFERSAPRRRGVEADVIDITPEEGGAS